MRPLTSLQALRGVAAWLVVYHHYMQGFHDLRRSTAVGEFFAINGKFGVDIFFVLSGFIMFYTLELHPYTAKEFLLRRLIRIVPLYWFMTLAFIAVLYSFPSPFTALMDWNLQSLVLSLLFVPHENPGGIGLFPLLTVGWTLNFEMFFYVWLGLMLLSFRRKWFIACAVSMILLPVVWSASWPYAAILRSTLLYEFVFGMFVAGLYLRGKCLRKVTGPMLGAVLFLTGVILYTQADCCTQLPLLWRLDEFFPYLAAASFVGAALAFEQFASRAKWMRAWQHLGDISYSTYLVHPISLAVCIYSLNKPQSWAEELTALGIYTALTLTLSELSYRWVETGHAVELLKEKLLAPRVSSNAKTALP